MTTAKTRSDRTVDVRAGRSSGRLVNDAPINLNKARKAKARAAAIETAARNRVLHGRTKAEKAAGDAARRTEERRLDQARREP